jgi:hypothetical protein
MGGILGQSRAIVLSFNGYRVGRRFALGITATSGGRCVLAIKTGPRMPLRDPDFALNGCS